MTLDTTTTSLLLNESRKRGLLLLCIFLFPLILTSIIFTLVAIIGDIDFKVIGNESIYAHIESPKNRSTVSEQFEISGSLETPLSNHSYYLVELRNKLYWPKFYLGTKETRWNKKLIHRAAKDQFSAYQVIMADSKLKNTFDTWFKTSHDTGKYPGIPELSIDKNDDISGRIVANIRVKTQ